MSISRQSKQVLENMSYKFGKKISKVGYKKPNRKPQGALHEARALTKLKQESLKLAQKVNADIMIENNSLKEERDYWMFKKQPKGFINKLRYVFSH